MLTAGQTGLEGKPCDCLVLLLSRKQRGDDGKRSVLVKLMQLLRWRAEERGKKRQLPELASWRQQKSHDLNIATLLVISPNLLYYCHPFLIDTNMIHAS